MLENAADTEALASVAEIMRRHGAQCGPAAFHQSVNVTFHEFESEVYDREHADMWESLPRQFALLVDDWIGRGADTGGDLRVLDIGCGTGLASQCLLNTRVGPRIRSIDLLDTSPAMLSKAGARAQTWGVPFACHQGLLDALPGDRRYDFIVVCSVLHHVPDLPAFLGEVRAHQSPGGVFLHLQDPNGDFLQDPERLRRSRETGDGPLPGSLQRFTPRRILGRLYREVTGKQHQDAVSKTNRALLDSRLIATPLSVQELYAITDIHVHDGRGISIRQMTAWLPEYECLSTRSYGYFGKLWSVLPPHLQKMEEQLIERKEPNGLHVGAIWKLSERPC